MTDPLAAFEAAESPSRPTHSRSRKRRRTSDTDGLQCQVCFRSYERLDHLNRHLDSHRNERSFRCDECPAGFNRRDLLLRHQATHAKNAAEGQVGPDRTAGRAVKACDACVISKVRCDNARPCNRCRRKNTLCTTKSVGPRVTSLSTLADEQPTSELPTPPGPQSPNHTPSNLTLTSEHDVEAISHLRATSDAQAIISLYDHALNPSQDIPSFFEQIMIPDLASMCPDPTQPPPTLTTWMPEAEWFGEVDLFSNEFAPTIDQTFEDQQVLDEFFAATKHNSASTQAPEATSQDEEARKRHAIFQRSPWLWVPDRNQHAFSEHDGPLLDERNVDIATSPHDPCSSNITIPDRLSSQTRDRIFQLVSKTAQSQISIPSFPSAECLDKLIKVGIAKRIETDAWIHPFAFCSETAMIEYLTALVAGGCVCFGIPSVSRTGLVLQEIVRVALSRLIEVDNSTIRDLQYLQASMIWLDIGAFCGFRRKMEIAESNLQPLVTALRRTGKFDHVAYRSIRPSADDSDEETDQKWRHWVQEESYKRLAYHLFEHDLSVTFVRYRNPLLSYSEISLPLPAPRSLWLAPSAAIWRTRWLAMDYKSSSLSLKTLLQDDSAIRCISPNIDMQVARSAYLYGLAAQVWEYIQQHSILRGCNDASSQLWLQSRQQRLLQSLRNLELSIEFSPAISCVLYYFLLMILNADLDIITRFAGKCGEEEARRAYAQLQPWTDGKEARSAVSHAGQLLRSARAIPPYQIRGQDAFMVYHAIMVLWTYSMMMKGQARRTAINTPARDQSRLDSQFPASPTDDNHLVFLDDPSAANKTDIEGFISRKSGRPCLHIPAPNPRRAVEATAVSSLLPTSATQGICDLRSPSQIMQVGVSLLEATHPDTDRESGPPMLRALCGLMEELGSLR